MHSRIIFVKNSWNTSSGVVAAFVCGAAPMSYRKDGNSFFGVWLLVEMDTDPNIHFM